jgi:small subunit ribosomal protein S16
VAVRIRLLRMGKIRNPQYRIVVADSRKKRDGRAIENLGLYHPKEEPSRIEIDSERVQYWLSVGAQPSDPVKTILRRTGDWQKFKGLPPPSTPLKVAPARADRTAIYEAEAKAAAGLAEKADKADKADKAKKADKAGKGQAEEKPQRGQKAPAKKAAKKATKATKAADTAEAPADTAEASSAETPAAETPAAETPAAEATAQDQTATASEEQAGAQSGEQA